MEQLRAWYPRRGLHVEVVRAKAGVKGFAVQPRRWIVERTFAWLTHTTVAWCATMKHARPAAKP